MIKAFVLEKHLALISMNYLDEEADSLPDYEEQKEKENEQKPQPKRIQKHKKIFSKYALFGQ